jgi:hypothetical protein
MADLRRITAMRLGLLLFTRNREVVSHYVHEHRARRIRRSDPAPPHSTMQPRSTAWHPSSQLTMSRGLPSAGGCATSIPVQIGQNGRQQEHSQRR